MAPNARMLSVAPTPPPMDIVPELEPSVNWGSVFRYCSTVTAPETSICSTPIVTTGLDEELSLRRMRVPVTWTSSRAAALAPVAADCARPSPIPASAMLTPMPTLVASRIFTVLPLEKVQTFDKPGIES